MTVNETVTCPAVFFKLFPYPQENRQFVIYRVGRMISRKSGLRLLVVNAAILVALVFLLPRNLFDELLEKVEHRFTQSQLTKLVVLKGRST